MNDKNLQVDIAILDFSKAFDVVPHQRLMNKLAFYGIHGPIHTWIRTFLEGRQQEVIVDGKFSEKASVDSGVPQGTVLGPLLFLLFINDLPDVVSDGTRVRLFADDCLIYRSIRSVQDQLILQRDLDRLVSWSDMWGMKFNAKKCNIMSTHKGLHLDRFYHMGGQVLSSVISAKYLGVTLSSDLSWSEHIAEVSKKANQKLGFIKRNLRGSPLKCKVTAYLTLVRSGLEYAAPIWDPFLKKDINLLESTQRRAARWVKSDYSWQSSVSQLLKTLEWAELADRRRNQRLILLHKIVNNQVDITCDDIGTYVVQRITRRGSKLGESGAVFNKKLYQPRAHTNTLQKAFVIRTIPVWNNLPVEVLQASSSTAFKSRLAALP
jgi:hypothetical protein